MSSIQSDLDDEKTLGSTFVLVEWTDIGLTQGLCTCKGGGGELN